MRLRIILLATAVSIPVMVFSQRNANVGVFVGTTYYMGDINPNRHFYRTKPALGFLYRYNFNSRYAVRVNAYYTDLSGNDLDFSERINPDRPVSPASFHTSLMDVGVQVEFNFLSYTPNLGRLEYTPYISAGIGGGFIMGSDVDATNLLNFPFGAGVKVNLTSRLAAGAEYSLRKTFNDHVDGIANPSGTYSFMHNNDWYNFLGLFITYKFFNFAKTCPAYN